MSGRAPTRGSGATVTGMSPGQLAEQVVRVVADGQLLAYIIPSSLQPEKTVFFTEPELKQQVGFVVYPRGGTIVRHVHKRIQRQLVGTSEVLLIRSGQCEVDIYTNERVLVSSHTLSAGDLLLMVDGGHGFRMTEDTVFLEIKQGPYLGVDEKERF